MVNVLTEPGGALSGAIALAEQITANGPLAVAATKRVLIELRAWAPQEVWSRQFEILAPIFESNDAKEGARASLRSVPHSGPTAHLGVPWPDRCRDCASWSWPASA